MATPEPGDVVANRYEIQAPIGSGGFAAAYKALDRETGETVAVKVPNFDGSNNEPDLIERYFTNEAETLERIRDAGGHPNLMNLLERTDVDGTPVLVVEYIDGYELDTVIDETGPFEDTELVRTVGMNLADAMGFLHENEIVYRDLKPDNAMLTDEHGSVTLIDFNTATAFEGGGSVSDDSTAIRGPYKPPEVADANSAEGRQGPWSDVYSIGKILMFLLKGTVPQKDGVDPRDFGAECEPYLAAVIERATRTDYIERYRNATVLQQVLDSRTAAIPTEAAVTHVETGEEYTVYPGDTIGRRFAEGPTPSITIEDPQEYISTVQVQFDVEDGEWILRDRSLNGTYVRTEAGWQRVLGEQGRRRLRSRGEDPTDRHGEVPPTTFPLENGDQIALVHPTYGVSFEFQTKD